MFTTSVRLGRAVAVTALLSAAACSPPAFADEAVVDRTAFSTTVDAGQTFKTRTYPDQVNFENEDGDWQAIDRSLRREADGSARPVAIDGDAVIPAKLTRPVVLEHDGQTVSFRLLGADSDADREVSGPEATFDDVLTGVDVEYKVRPNGLKETITLASAASRRTFSYDVRADSDLTATIIGGDLVFKDASGEEQFRVAAPLAWDSAKLAETANALTLSVSRIADRQWRLTMRADDKWLDDPARVYPVTLDPDYYWIDGTMRFHGANQDCALAGGNQSTLKQCAYQNLQIGYGNNRPYKSVMKFNISAAIPANSIASSARFLAWQFPSTQKFAVSSRLRTVTSDWDNNATWNVRKTNTPWTTAGSDVSTDPALIGDPITIGPSGYWSYWPAPLAAVNGWIKGTLPNYGFQISTDLTTPTVKSAYEFTSTDGNQANWPALEVTWTPDGPPTLDLSGDFINRASTPFVYNDAPDAVATSKAQGADIRDIIAKVDGVTVDQLDGDDCGPACKDLTGRLTIPMDNLSPGSHTLTVTATDVKSRARTTSVAFTRGPSANYPSVVSNWSASVNQALGSASGAKPAAAMPTIPDAALQQGACASEPGSATCVKAVVTWAANFQDWLRTAANPAAAPELPTFPAALIADADKQDAARVVAGAIRFAARVAKAAGQPQSAGVSFTTSQTANQVLAELGPNVLASPVAIQGGPAAGEWALDREVVANQSVSAALDAYYAAAVAQMNGVVTDLQADANEDPSDDSVQAAIADANAYRTQVQARGPVVGGVSALLSGAYANTVLRRAANGAAVAIVTAQEGVAPANLSALTAQVAAPAATTQTQQARLAAAAPSEPTCSQRNEEGTLRKEVIERVNPAFWAPSRFAGDSFVVPDAEEAGTKGHRLKFRWLADRSLAWLCQEPNGRRGVEIEARVGEFGRKFSDGWAKPRSMATNLPGRRYYDDIADGDNFMEWEGNLIPTDKQDYPDFSIVSDKQKSLKYRKLYYTFFRTNKGQGQGEGSEQGLISYTAQQTRYARSTGERGYCNTIRGGSFPSCMFSATTVCYANTTIDGPRQYRRIDWRELLGTGALELTSKNTTSANWDSRLGHVIAPCRPGY